MKHSWIYHWDNKDLNNGLWYHSFSTYAKFSEKPNTSYADVSAYQGVRNVSFLENFAYVLNKWSIFNSFRPNISLCFVAFGTFPVFPVNNRDTRKRCKIYSKLSTKTPQQSLSYPLKTLENQSFSGVFLRYKWRCSGVFIATVIVIVILLFYCWLWTGKCLKGWYKLS